MTSDYKKTTDACCDLAELIAHLNTPCTQANVVAYLLIQLMDATEQTGIDSVLQIAYDELTAYAKTRGWVF